MKTIACIALSLCLPLTAAAAQQHSAKPSAFTAYKLIALKATGTTRYSDKEILAASGLQLGQNAAEGDFKEAAQRLGNSGLFSDVVYSFSATPSGVRLELQLADIDKSKLVPAHFENFIWFTDDELQSTLHSRVPLFKQLLPLGGNLADRVSEALQAMLGEKHLPGRVSYLRESQGESGGALVGIAYRVEEVGIRIQSVEFPGASPEHAAFLTAAAHQLIGMAYSRPALAAVAKFDLLPVYLQRGYLKAEFEPSNARVVSQSPTDPDAPASDPKGPVDRQAEVEVVAAIPVTPGKMYSSSGVDWKGDSAIATADLVPILHLPPGEPVDAVRLLRDIDNVGKLYRSRGYMMIQVKDDARFDDEKATVHYDINIVEGDLYKMGELEITGLDTQSKARMEAAWTLHEGQNYNADYPKKYRDDIGPLLPRGVRWAIIIHETPDARDKTVDVEIHFKQQ